MLGANCVQQNPRKRSHINITRYFWKRVKERESWGRSLTSMKIRRFGVWSTCEGVGIIPPKRDWKAINVLNGDSWPSRPLCFQYFTLYIRVRKTVLGNRTGPSGNNERYQYEGSQSTLKWTSKSTSHCPLWAHSASPLLLIMSAQSRCSRHLAAATKSLQRVFPIDGSPPGSPVPGILQARTLEWGAISFSKAWKWKVKSLSHVQLFATPWSAAYQAPLSMGFSKQEYWNGVPLPSPRHLAGPLK